MSAKGVFFCAVHWISHHVPKPKKNRESSPRGPFPPVVNRISPLRAMYFFYFSSFILWLLFLIWLISLFIVNSVCCSVFVYLYLIFSVPFIAFPSHPKTQKQQIQNPKSKLQNPDQKARLPWADAAASSPTPLTSNLDEKLCCLPDVFSFNFFACHQSCGVSFRAVHWISHQVPKRKKKLRELPLGGPSPVW